MQQYLVTIQLPDDFDPSTVDEAMIRNIDGLNQEMDAAFVTMFAYGLSPASQAKSLRKQPDGEVVITDGPYLEAKEHIRRLLDPPVRRHGRSAGLGSQSRHRLPRAGRGARDLLPPTK